MRKKIVAGNHKMNLDKNGVIELMNEINSFSFNEEHKELMVFPSSLFLDAVVAVKRKEVKVGAQNAHYEKNGAFTGEVSFEQLKNLGLTHVLIGHSERREIFGENNQTIKAKIDKAIEVGLQPIFCCGEPLQIRENKNQKEFVIQQLKESVFHLSEEAFEKVIIAYEPIWAIGTGKTANAEQAEEMHKDIRASVALNYSEKIANNTSILYGGSCKPQNAKELFACNNVDGGLIGGAALNAVDFIEIAKAL
jgi:triosephosphate isomerase